jgi:uncharacterized protein (DUF58 family)
MFFLITFGVGFAALNTGNNLLYLVLSLMLSFLVLSGVMSESALRGIRVRRHLPRELFAGAPATVGLEITNQQARVPSFAVLIQDRLLEDGLAKRNTGRCFAIRIGPGETVPRSYSFIPKHRGPIRFVEFEVFTRFPFGLFSKSLTLESENLALVYPGIEPLSVPPDFGAAREVGDGICSVEGAGSAVSGLREYASGDPVRRIHWRRSLRKGTLLVRQIENEQQREIEVRLRTAGQQPGEAFERAVRWTASEVVALLETGSRVSLRTDGTLIQADHGASQRGRLLGFLAKVTPAARVSEAT